jgi:hypothetical protein
MNADTPGGGKIDTPTPAPPAGTGISSPAPVPPVEPSAMQWFREVTAALLGMVIVLVTMGMMLVLFNQSGASRSSPSRDGTAASVQKDTRSEPLRQKRAEIVSPGSQGRLSQGSSSATASPGDGGIGTDRGDSFDRQKDLLLLAIALLGTVTGYYFGRVPAELRASQANQSAVVANNAANVASSSAAVANQNSVMIREQARQTLRELERVKRDVRETLKPYASARPESSGSESQALPAEVGWRISDLFARLESTGAAGPDQSNLPPSA